MKASTFLSLGALCILTGFTCGRFESSLLDHRRERSESSSAAPKTASTHAGGPSFKSRWDHENSLRGRLRLGISTLDGNATGSGSMAEWMDAARRDRAATALLAELSLTTRPREFLTALTRDFALDPSEDWRFALAEDFAIRWSKLDFDAAFHTCLGRSGLTRHRLASAVMQTGLATQPTKALRILGESPDFHLTLSGNPNQPPALTLPPTPENLALVRALPPIPAKTGLIRAIAATLPIEEAYALAGEDQRINSLPAKEDAGHHLVDADPAKAQQWHAENPDHPASLMIAAFIGQKLLAENHPDQAAAWAAANTHGAFREFLIGAAASALDATDPAAAAEARQYLLSPWKENPQEP